MYQGPTFLHHLRLLQSWAQGMYCFFFFAMHLCYLYSLMLNLFWLFFMSPSMCSLPLISELLHCGILLQVVLLWGLLWHWMYLCRLMFLFLFFHIPMPSASFLVHWCLILVSDALYIHFVQPQEYCSCYYYSVFIFFLVICLLTI